MHSNPDDDHSAEVPVPMIVSTNPTQALSIKTDHDGLKGRVVGQYIG